MDMTDMTTDLEIGEHLRDTLAVFGWNMDMKDKDKMDMKIRRYGMMDENMDMTTDLEIGEHLQDTLAVVG